MTTTTPRFYQQYPDTCLAAFDDERPFAAETGDLSRKRGNTQYTLERRYINSTLSPSTPASSDFLINARKEIIQEISARMSDPEVPIDKNFTMLSARNSGLLRRLDFSTDEIVTGPDYQPPLDEDCAAARPAWLEWPVTPEVRKLQRSRPHKRNSQYSDAQMDLYCHLRVKGDQVREEWKWLESEGYKPWLVKPAMQECEKEENGRDKYAGEKCESNGYGTAEHDGEGDEGCRNEWEEFLAHFATQHTATHTGGVHSDPGFAESDQRPEIRIYRPPYTRTVVDVQFKSLERPPKRSDFLWRARARMLKRTRSSASWSDDSDVSGPYTLATRSECSSVEFKHATPRRSPSRSSKRRQLLQRMMSKAWRVTSRLFGHKGSRDSSGRQKSGRFESSPYF